MSRPGSVLLPRADRLAAAARRVARAVTQVGLDGARRNAREAVAADRMRARARAEAEQSFHQPAAGREMPGGDAVRLRRSAASG